MGEIKKYTDIVRLGHKMTVGYYLQEITLQ